ncbi:MAG: TetR/AcrR family transcriptional regulator C-terminal domain-containing protein [Micropruina sp.]|uniref:TetR/AcrR family transcriptional regulator n=1 Tax=Micropruina sp. TaxID=2737536 RepID=UPI0039E44468
MSRRLLSPAMIVDAAVAIAARPDAGPLTGRVLGDELGVDRSAVWRHFPDQDALLRAVGDRLLELALAAVPDGLDPERRMMALARAVVATFVDHPQIGAVIASRTTQGPGELATVEFTLRALREAGVPHDQVGRQQRILADTVLSYAGMRAGRALLTDEIRRRDQQAWMGTYATASAQTHPAIADHVHALAAVTDDEVLEGLLAALAIAVRTVAERPAEGDGHATR